MAGITLKPVAERDRRALRGMFEPYLIALAAMTDPRGLQGDPTAYGYFDSYWQEPDRRALWIRRGPTRVGFILINAYSPSGLGCDQAVAEFCIQPQFRRSGLGLAAAKALFESQDGQWELQVQRANRPGTDFWAAAIAQVEPHDHEMSEQAERVIHRFRRRPAA